MNAMQMQMDLGGLAHGRRDRRSAEFVAARLSATLAKDLDHWIRRRLRAYVWKQWRLPRTKVRNLKACGVRHKWAMMVGNTRKGEWRLSKNGTLCAALPDAYFTRSLGLVLLGPSSQ